jgi:hypothetical protein
MQKPLLIQGLFCFWDCMNIHAQAFKLFCKSKVIRSIVSLKPKKVMSKPTQNSDKNPKVTPGQNKPQAPKDGNRGDQMNPIKEQGGKKK